MKTIPFSLCTGIALLGSIACGNSDNPGSGLASSAGAGPTPSAAGSGGSSTPVFVNGGNGSIIVPDMGGGPSSSNGETCAPGNTTTISGVVYDPAGKNPLYNISVFVLDPTSPLPDLEKIPVSCGCSQLMPAKVRARSSAPTDASGHFEIPCAPSGNVSLVVQTGKWRRQYDNVNVVANQANVIPNLRLPANSSEGSLPNIAISTGGSDSFECLPLRLGVSASEYVAGSATGGHIHIYSGFNGATPAQGAVESNKALWDTQAHLNEHDVVVLSCEGQETTGGQTGTRVGAAAQQLMMNYANGGGRVFASHYQYAWFNTGPFAAGANNLANWTPGMGTVDDTQAFPAEINTTLSNGMPFPEGSALATWLGLVGALTNNQLPVRFVRNNVKSLLAPSTEWIHLAASVTKAPSAPQYFSADTPVGASGDNVCGRVVYSALHVSGGPGQSVSGVAADADYPTGAAGATGAGGGTGMGMFPMQAKAGTVPSGCSKHALTPQEAALEFMFFDLSSCLVPIGEEPPVIPK